MRTFIPFIEARECVLEASKILGSETIHYESAAGRTLAEDITAKTDIPPFNNSAMDGFAIRSEDIPDAGVTLRVVADIPAGSAGSGRVGPGEAARIMTGAPIPEGANAVIPVEQTEQASDTEVKIMNPPRGRTHIRAAGEDVRTGTIVLRSGTVITPPVVGMCATLGATQVRVRTRPRAAVISTGDEIVPAERVPGPGQIRNSNGPALAAQVRSAGAEPVHVLHALDTPEAVRFAVEQAADADVLIFSGGVSMGAYDYVRTELEAMGARWEFWKVRQRPGKPLAFGMLHGQLLVGLPGNPVSSAICFEMYLRPLFSCMLGRTSPMREMEPAELSEDVNKVEELYTFARGVVERHDGARPPRVSLTGAQGSNLYSSMVAANCIIHLPDGLAHARKGDIVMIERLNWTV